MKNLWRRSRTTPKVDPQELNQQSAEILDKLEKDGPRMRAIAAFLENRRDQNGFGTDFEYTLRPRRAS